MKKVTKRLCASLLALAMVVGVCPSTAYAAPKKDVEVLESLLNGSMGSLGESNNFEGFGFESGMFDFSAANATLMALDGEVVIDAEDPTMAAVAAELEEIEVTDEEGNKVALTEEQIATVLGMYQKYLDHWTANADTLGVQVPFFLNYNDKEEDGLGILGEMLALGGVSVEDVRTGNYSYDDLTGMIMNFMFGDQLGVQFYGEAIKAARDAALKAVKDSGAVTEVQKLLVLNSWLAHNAEFDMSYIMNSGKEEGKEPMFAEDPQKHVYYDYIYQAIYDVYEPQIRDQFEGQIRDGLIAVLKQTFYEEAIKAGYSQGVAEKVEGQYVAQTYQAMLEQTDLDAVYTAAYEAAFEAAYEEAYNALLEETVGAVYEEAYKAAEKAVYEEAYTVAYNEAYEVAMGETYAEVFEKVYVEAMENGASDAEAEAKADEEAIKAVDEAAVAVATAKADEEILKEEVIAKIKEKAQAEAEAQAGEKVAEEAKAKAEEKADAIADAEVAKVEADLQAQAEAYVKSDEVQAEIKAIVETQTEAFMTENAEAISADAPGFVLAVFGEEVAAQFAVQYEYFIADAEENGVAMDPAYPDYKMTIDQIVAQQMDQPVDDLGGATPNQAIPMYADQAATGLTDGVLNYWQGSHIGVFGGGSGVCLGYSKAFTYLVQAMNPAVYGVNGANTDMTVAANWKTAADLYYNEAGELDITKNYSVDMVRITFAAQVTMFGETEDNFNSDHFWNAVQVDGQWYYIDPCYTDVFVEVMSRDRVETNGNMSHLYFMFSHDSAAQLYEGNYSVIKTLYAEAANSKAYEDFWTSRIASNVYSDGSNFYYLYDSTDMITMLDEYNNQQNYQEMEETTAYYKLVSHPIQAETANSNGDTDYTTYIEFNYVEDEEAEDPVSVARVLNPETGELEESEFLTALFAQHAEDGASHPSIEISAAYYDGKLYFNLSNRILSYDLETGAVVTVKEYNVVYAERDKTNPFGGMAFTITDEETDHVVVNSPIAGMTIKADGKMYVDVATNYAFISGKNAVDDQTSYGYEYEETNFNKDYNSYMDYGDYSDAELEQYGYKKEINDNDEFMWSANFVETLDMAHLSGEDHDYENVRIDAHCGRNAYREARCTTCGASEAGSRIEVEGTALNHHYIKFEETYYTKDDNGNFNTATNHVCTSCKKSYEADEEEDVLTENDHIGHEYVGVITKWNADYTEATADILCTRCYGGDLDCLLNDNSIELTKNVKSTDITKERYYEVVEIEVDEEGNETEVKEYYWLYTANFKYADGTYVGTDLVEREEDMYDRNPFTDVKEGKWYAEAVLWAYENGYVAGYEEEDGTYTFRPSNNATRAESVTFLWRVDGEELVEDVENPFTDVAEGKWYYEEVMWAYDSKVTVGYEEADGTFTFRPGNNCTRAEILAFICRVKGNPTASEDAENPFTDIKDSKWYYNDVMWAVEEGIVSGYEEADGTFTFRPDAKCTRAEIVQMLYRAFAE